MVQSSALITGTGAALPRTAWSLDMVRAQFGEDASTQAQAAGDLACEAALNACRAAKIEVTGIDLIVSASAVPYQTLPSSAPLIMSRLGLADGTAAAFDVNSTCLSFLTGLEAATRMIDAGQAQTALVVSAEIASRALPWQQDPSTAALFGDGAGAVILQAGSTGGGLQAALMRSYPSAYDACSIRAGGTRIDYHADPDGFAQNAWFEMDGRELFRLSSRHFKGFVGDLLAKAGWTPEDVDLIIPHQASPAGLAHMIKQVNVPTEKVINIVAHYGNQIAASLPFAFDHAVTSGRVPAGSKVLFLGTSAGVSFGGVAWQT